MSGSWPEAFGFSDPGKKTHILSGLVAVSCSLAIHTQLVQSACFYSEISEGLVLQMRGSIYL